MDYPFELEAGVCYCFFPWHNSEIFKNCNGIFWFSDPNFGGFFVQKNGWADVNQIFFRWPPYKNIISEYKPIISEYKPIISEYQCKYWLTWLGLILVLTD